MTKTTGRMLLAMANRRASLRCRAASAWRERLLPSMICILHQMSCSSCIHSKDKRSSKDKRFYSLAASSIVAMRTSPRLGCLPHWPDWPYADFICRGSREDMSYMQQLVAIGSGTLSRHLGIRAGCAEIHRCSTRCLQHATGGARRQQSGATARGYRNHGTWISSE